jgi:hypothetical protein
VQYETPSGLLGRLRLGREEFCQRLLTTLILHAPYPRWNTRSVPSARGISFLRRVYEQTLGPPWPGDDLVFVDEFELPPRDDAERGGAPDYAVLWPDRLWLIELKTERASHRRDQIPSYFGLAHHHYPLASIDLLYVTPPMTGPYAPGDKWGRYAHVAWPDLVPAIQASWPARSDPGQQEVVDGLVATVENLHVHVADWRSSVSGVLPTATFDARDVAATANGDEEYSLRQALELAALTS